VLCEGWWWYGGVVLVAERTSEGLFTLAGATGQSIHIRALTITAEVQYQCVELHQACSLGKEKWGVEGHQTALWASGWLSMTSLSASTYQ
jgi:hypothetical protein